MTVTDQIKNLNRKIMQNEAHYDLDREAAKVSALSSNNLDKYEDLGLKPSSVEKAKFEYCQLGKIFNKGLSEDDKKEGLLKKLKNIEDKNEQLLKIKNKTENLKEVTDFVGEPLSPEAKALTEEIRAIQKDVDYRKLITRGGNNVTYDFFSNYKTFNELHRDLYYKNMTINNAEMKQNKFNSTRIELNNYTAKDKKYIEAKNSLINNAKNFYKRREKIIKGFKEKIFPIKSDAETEQQRTSKKSTKADVNTFSECVIKKETGINREIFKNYFHSQIPPALLKDLYKTNGPKKKKNAIVNLIKSELKDLQEEIKNMSQGEIKNEKPDEIVEIVEEILKFNKQKQSGQRLKILAPSQMLSRLPTSLAELKAGNNSFIFSLSIKKYD